MNSTTTMAGGAISCLFCKGSVSLKCGTLDKFKLHMDNNHDAFFDQDILIAVNFLEEIEKEAIIEKVLPRILNVLGKEKNSNDGTAYGNGPTGQKRTLEHETDHQDNPSSKRFFQGQVVDEVDNARS